MPLTAARILALAALLLCCSAALASANSLKLSWDRCSGDGDIGNKVFTCDTNEGTATLVCSVVLDSLLPAVYGFDADLDLRSTAAVVPSWWDFSMGGCRDYTYDPRHLQLATTPIPATPGCRNGWQGPMAGGIAGVYTMFTPNPTDSPSHHRIGLSLGTTPASAFAIRPGEENVVFRLSIDLQNTVGLDACDGCSAPICFTLGRVILGSTLPGGGWRYTHLPDASTDGTRATVTANGAGHSAVTMHCGFNYGCYFDAICSTITPAQNRTWGTIKSMYR